MFGELLKRAPKTAARCLWVVVAFPLAGHCFLGCADKAPPKKPPPEELKAKEASEPVNTETISEEVALDERLAYSYNPIGKRDPFRSFIRKDTVTLEDLPETPLQKYEIDQFLLVAVVWGTDEPLAMVEDPEGMGHFLKKGVLIGKNWGKVVRITQQEVIVAEEYRDFEGKLIVNEIPLKLPEED